MVRLVFAALFLSQQSGDCKRMRRRSSPQRAARARGRRPGSTPGPGRKSWLDGTAGAGPGRRSGQRCLHAPAAGRMWLARTLESGRTRCGGGLAAGPACRHGSLLPGGRRAPAQGRRRRRRGGRAAPGIAGGPQPPADPPAPGLWHAVHDPAGQADPLLGHRLADRARRQAQGNRTAPFYCWAHQGCATTRGLHSSGRPMCSLLRSPAPGTGEEPPSTGAGRTSTDASRWFRGCKRSKVRALAAAQCRRPRCRLSAPGRRSPCQGARPEDQLRTPRRTRRLPPPCMPRW